MKISDFAKEINAEILTMPRPDAEITGGYCGDLLSWVMGRAEEGQVWITIMSNVNIIAVASLADVACIILSEGVVLDADIIETAKQKEINILYSAKPSYETAVVVSELI